MVRVIFLFVVVLFSLCVEAQFNEVPVTSDTDPHFNRLIEREKALNWIKNPAVPEIKIENTYRAPEHKKKFLRHMSNVWAPFAEQIQIHNIRWYVYFVSLDRGLYNNEVEKKEWMKKKEQHANEKNRIMQSQEFREATNKLHSLAEGLNGSVVNFAERYWQQMMEFEPRDEDKELTNEESRLDGEIVNALTGSKISGEMLMKTANRKLQIEKNYYSGNLTFQEAAQELHQLVPNSLEAKGEDVGKTARDALNEMAVIKTKLAHRRNFNTHAEFMFATKANFFGPGMKTPQERIGVLKGVLKETKPLMEEVYRHLWRQKDSLPNFEELTSTELSLLLPETESMVSAFFPKERAIDFWREFFVESGFSEDQLNEVVIDSYPREGKQTHAYMAGQSLRRPKYFVVDARSLEIKVPDSDPENWYSARVSIVHNIQKDAPKDYKTAGHELGHYLDFENRKFIDGLFMLIDNEGDPVQATPRSETPSLAMEKVLEDRTFLLAKLKDREGRPISETVLDKYLENKKIERLVQFRLSAFGALYDYSLWNYDFENGSETFVERAKRLAREMDEAYFFGREPANSPVDRSYRLFSVPHFIGGSVKYDYFYAEQTAEMVHHWLLDLFERETGRRTYLNQPMMASALIKNLYASTHDQPYPQSIERFTGQKFNLKDILDSFRRTKNEILGSEGSSSAIGGCIKELVSKGA